MNLLLVAFVLVSISAAFVEGVCNVCGVNSAVQCTSETSFTFCQGGAPTTQTGSCPAGQVCADVPTVCTSNVVPDCGNLCSVCDSTNSFACISQTTFALCFGTSVPSTITGTCTSGTVCNIMAPGGERCVAPATGASCTNAVTTTAPTNPSVFCQSMQAPGRYPVLGSNCKRYIYCYYINGSFVGGEYECVGTTLFNPVYQQCIANYTCTA